MVRKRVTTRIFAATEIRSCNRMIFETAAAISGVKPGASAAKAVGAGIVRKQPVAKFADGQMRDRRERRGVVRDRQIRRVTSSSSYGIRLGEKGLQRHIGQRHLRRARVLRRLRAAMPASSSPERSGDAFARRPFRSAKQ